MADKGKGKGDAKKEAPKGDAKKEAGKKEEAKKEQKAKRRRAEASPERARVFRTLLRRTPHLPRRLMRPLPRRRRRTLRPLLAPTLALVRVSATSTLLIACVALAEDGGADADGKRRAPFRFADTTACNADCTRTHFRTFAECRRFFYRGLEVHKLLDLTPGQCTSRALFCVADIVLACCCTAQLMEVR